MSVIELLNKKMTVSWDTSSLLESDKIFLEDVMKEVEWVINQANFREFILKHTWEGNPGFYQSDNSPEWHLKQFVEGNERDKTAIDYEVDHFVNFYYKRFSKAIAYTNLGSLDVNLNRKFIGTNVPEYVNTMVHEYCHLVGMHHSYNRDIYWIQTAPYAIGNYAQLLVERKNGIDNNDVYYPPTNLWSRIKRKLIFWRW